ncbi:hypothetical protein [Aurantiacibacter poecillastricola]|uniref:hypothetical protein n=1 Tax=Aurantiacibacter poecillastricola TaxID=3064385 RepID=UPI0027401C3D|nr:hypothetical protein [Aurantiacibacter sp. 219JJ12-13]MDP5261646.1 hypothetical protein [Aurantiacibacter sp. 219JJ12-13]
MTRGRVRKLHLRGANDNRRKQVASPHLDAALRHFAEHGLAAARHARQQAMIAADAGDRQGFEWWLEICRALDRRMANEIATPATAGG